jgi:hypothetical protein
MRPLIAAIALSVPGTLLRAGTQDVQDVYYVPSLLTKFLHFADAREKRSTMRHDLERERLEAAIESTQVEGDRELLSKTVEENELSRLEERNVFNEMRNFINSVKGVMGSEQPKPQDCAEVTCGEGASCALKTDGATCVCDEGFVGDGFVCKRPVAFVAKMLLPSQPSAQVGDLHMAQLGKALLCVYRDLATERGYLLVGHVSPATVEWSKPLAFSQAAAFSPQVAVIPEDRFVISYRDANTQGAGFFVGGQLVKTDAGVNATFGEPVAFARMQSHQTSLLSLPGARFAIMFCEHKGDGQAFGSALLGRVGAHGVAEQQGIFPFAESAVTRLTATLLSPESFVVAYRAAPDPTADPLTAVREEANAVYAKLTSTDLVFDPHPLQLEPHKSEIWDRGLGLLTANRFQYTYQMGTEDKTVVAVVEVDRYSHRMHVTSKHEVAQGFTPFARSVGLAFSPGAPRTLSFYEHHGVGKYTACSLTTQGALTGCTERTWLSHPVESVTSTSLGDARVLFVFAGKDGKPYYQVAALNSA